MSHNDSSDKFFNIVILLMLPAALIINGLLLKVMWGWFMVPLGLRPVGIAHALGISLLVGLLAGSEESNKEPAKRFIGMIIKPIIYLIFGATFYAFM
jgi:hypothetical protein